jgi:DNA invertase Pin-like site-specific DNA recombinase
VGMTVSTRGPTVDMTDGAQSVHCQTDDRYCDTLTGEPTMTTTAIPGRRTRTRAAAPMTVAAGYLRVSTAEQADSGLGLDSQRTAITAYAEAQGLTVAGWFIDAGVSGTTAPADRPGMGAALDTLADHGAGVLIAAKQDRFSRDTEHLSALYKRAQREGWRLVTANGQLKSDNSPQDRFLAGIYAAVDQNMRDTIAERTRDALAALKARGVQLGQPTKLPDAVLTRIIRELSEGRSLRAIARGLETDGIRTATGREHWHPQQVRTAADSQRGQTIAAALFGDQDADAAAQGVTV